MLGVSSEEMSTQQMKSLAHLWQSYRESNASTKAHCIPMNKVFANCSEENEIYPLTTVEIAKAQQVDATLKLFKHNAVIDKGLEIKLIENTTCVCKDGRLVIPKPLQVCAVKWYHHYLHHPGHTYLKGTMSTAMYWNGMLTTIQSITRSYKTCQTNKRWKLKYQHLLPKTITSNPRECLCVGLNGQYTLKGNDILQIDLMALTMIDPTSRWFVIVELPVVT
jgi:hypothetical protein